MSVLVSPSSTQSITAAGRPQSRAVLEARIINHLAEVRAVSSDDIRQELQRNGGDLAITDLQAKTICVGLEDDYNCDGMFRPVPDLCGPMEPTSGDNSPVKHGGCVDPAEDTTVSSLLTIAAHKFGI